MTPPTSTVMVVDSIGWILLDLNAKIVARTRASEEMSCLVFKFVATKVQCLEINASLTMAVAGCSLCLFSP